MYLVKYRKHWAEYDPTTRTRRSLHTPDRLKAEAIFAERQELRKRVKENVGTIVDEYLAAKEDKPSIRRMREAWVAAKPHFQTKRPADVTDKTIKAFIDARRSSGVSDGTIRKELGVLRQALRWHDPKNAPAIELPPSPPPRERHLTRDEYIKLLESCDAPHLKLFIRLALNTGARKGALLDLTWDRVDLERGLIALSKGVQTNKRRATVPINGTLKTALLESRKGNISGYVIEYRGKPVKDIKIGFAKACQRASGATIHAKRGRWWAEGGNEKWDDVTPHTLRHTAAVWMAEGGIPISEIAQFLGHTNINITYKVYARFTPDYLRKAASVLDV